MVAKSIQILILSFLLFQSLILPGFTASDSIDTLIANGEKVFQQQDYPQARQIFLNILKLAQDSPKAGYIQYQIARTYFREKNYATAITAANDVITKYSGSEKAPAAYWLMGYCYLRSEEYSNATIYFNRVIDNYPKSSIASDAALRIARILYMQPDNKLNESVAAFKRVIDNYPDSEQAVEALASYGQLLWAVSERGQTVEKKKEVLDLFFQLLKKSVGNEKMEGFAQMQIAALTMEIARLKPTPEMGPYLDQAITECQKVTQNYRNAEKVTLATAQLMEAECYSLKGDCETALAKFKQIISSYSNEPTCAIQSGFAQYMLGLTQYNLGNHDEAIAEFTKVGEKYQQKDNFAGNNIQASSLYWLGEIKRRQGVYENAEQDIKQLINDYPRSSEAQLAVNTLQKIKSHNSK